MNDFQKRVFDAVSASDLLTYEQAELTADGKIAFPICGGFVHVDIPEAIQHFAWARSTASNGAMNEHDLRRAANIASVLAEARDGKPIRRMDRENS